MLNDFGKELFKPWCSVQNFVVGLSILFLMAVAIMHFHLNSTEIASWVQAVGSIAAIWGAFRISSMQVLKQEAHRKQDELKKSNARLSVVRNAAAYAQATGQYLEKNPESRDFIDLWNTLMDTTTASALDSLRLLPVYELGSYKQVLLYNEILGALSIIRSVAKNFIDGDDYSAATTSAAYNRIRIQAVMMEGHWLDFQRDHLLSSVE